MENLRACSLRALFIALNDESAWVRALAIQMAGRLAPQNPALVLPALRSHLQQLLADMERSPDSRQREGGAVQTKLWGSDEVVLPTTYVVHPNLYSSPSFSAAAELQPASASHCSSLMATSRRASLKVRPSLSAGSNSNTACTGLSVGGFCMQTVQVFLARSSAAALAW